MKYKNIRTGKVVFLKEITTVRSFPDNISVVILGDGSQMEKSLFFDNHVLQEGKEDERTE